MAIQLSAASRIDWVRTQATPSGFDTISVFTGQQGGSASPALEIAVAKWIKPGEPNRDAVSKLHQLRVNQRVTPVVLIVEVTGGAILFGPNASIAPTSSLPVDQVERIVQAVLDETTPLAARTRLQSLLQSLDTTSIPGVKNSGLFANHELKDGVPQRDLGDGRRLPRQPSGPGRRGGGDFDHWGVERGGGTRPGPGLAEAAGSESC